VQAKGPGWTVLAIVLAASVSACSGAAIARGGHRNFMPVDGNGIPTTMTISDVHVGLLTEIYVAFPSNSLNGTVRVSSVRLVDPPPGIRLQDTSAYRVRALPGLPTSGQAIFGTRSPGCPRNYLGPQPVTAITLAPHKAGQWIAQILLTVAAPGSYRFAKAKISYTVDGASSWQYENLGLVIRYEAPSQRALLRIPRRDDGCPAHA
jgi:hypothetical protein